MSRKEEREAEQLATLKQQITLTGEPVPVRASHGIVFLVLLTCVAIWCARTAIVSPGFASIGAFAFAALLTFGFASIYIPRIGKPALTIRRDGIEVPMLGFFAWDEIESIGLQKYTYHGLKSYSLDLYVPSLHRREDRLHPLQRFVRGSLLRGSGGSFVVTHLHSSSLPPAVVHALCYDLWKQRTGKSKKWSSVLSEEQIEEFQRADEQIEMLKRAGELIDTDPAEAMRRLDEMEKRFGKPGADPAPRKRVSAAEAARRDALLADLKSIDPLDHEARKKLIERHVQARMRAATRKAVIVIVVFGVLLAVWLVLSGG